MAGIDQQSIERKYVSLRNLYLDPNNYRFIDNKSYRKVERNAITDDVIQKRTLNFIVGEKQTGISDLINSFKSNGFLPVDQIQVEPLENGGYRVLEGNRRVATLKSLASDYQSDAIDLGKLNPDVFSKVPVVVYTEGRTGEHEIIMGLKHISGPKKWSVLNQSQLIADLIQNHNWTEEDAYQSLGITKHELRRRLRTIALINLYKESDYGDQFETEMFGIFREIVASTNLKEWIGWDEEHHQPTNSENTERLFGWLSEVSEVKQLKTEEGGEETDEIVINREKVITKSGDISTLAKIINDPEAIKELEETRSVIDAYSASAVVKEDKYTKALLNIEQQLEDAAQFSRYTDKLDKSKLEAFIDQIHGILVSKGYKNTLLDQLSGTIKKVYIQYTSNQFDQITFDDYKGFESGLCVKGLNRINLFAGDNNTGKSSLLEAVYSLAIQNDINAFIELQRRRGKFINGVSSQWLARSVKPFKLSALFDGKEVALEVGVFNEENAEMNKADYLNTILMKGTFNHEKSETRVRLYLDLRPDIHYKEISSLFKATFSSPFTSLSRKALSDFHEESVESGTFDKIVEFISAEIDRNITDITKVGEGEDMRFLVAHKKFDEPLDITQFGEGLQRIFNISLQIASAKNGVMCIDEVENAIHHSLLLKFTKFLQLLSEDFNVQLFITTHSNECVKAFFENEYRNEDISGYRLQRTDLGISYLGETGKALQNQIENFSLDLRG